MKCKWYYTKYYKINKLEYTLFYYHITLKLKIFILELNASNKNSLQYK